MRDNVDSMASPPFVHRTRASLHLAAFVVGSLLASLGTALGQESEGSQSGGRNSSYQEVHPLASKEEMIYDRFERFADRVYRLREQLAEVEPENASRLRRVLERAGELGLGDRLEEMSDLLREPSSLTEAADSQAKWLADADRVLAILLERDSENAQREQAIERLQEYYEKLAEILKEQRDLRDASAKAGMGGRMLEQLKQAIERIDALLERQAKISRETEQMSPSAGVSPPAGAGKLPSQSGKASENRLGDKQKALSRDAAQLAEDLKRLGEMSPAAGEQPDASSDDTSEESAGEATKAAASSVQDGASSMSQASESLKQGAAQSARGQQQQAEQALREARERLEDAKRRLQDQEDAQSAAAEEQQQLAEKTGDLSAQMKQDASAGGQQGQQGGKPGQQGGKQGSSSQSQQNLDQAQSEMQDASQALGESKPEEATPSQDRAIDQLEQAQKELEEALSQLRQEEREETLRDLEARFREMLSRQRAVNDATLRLDQIGRKNFRRAEQLQLADLSTQERTLSQDAATCLHILDEDGTTIAFPRVVGQLSGDMATVAERLAGYRVGQLTQTIEQEIVETLEQLLEAVQRMQQENEQQSMPGGNMADGESPLLPPSAELKLLRASQSRINTRTTVIESARTEQTEPVELLTAALQKVATRQVQCAKIAQDMRDLLHQP